MHMKAFVRYTLILFAAVFYVAAASVSAQDVSKQRNKKAKLGFEKQ